MVQAFNKCYINITNVASMRSNSSGSSVLQPHLISPAREDFSKTSNFCEPHTLTVHIYWLVFFLLFHAVSPLRL